MNLNEIIGTLNELKDIIEMTCPMSDHVIEAIAGKADKSIQDLTPHSPDEKPKDGQVCLIFTKQGTAFGLWIEASGWFDFEYFELGLDQINGWLPSPEWKEDE